MKRIILTLFVFWFSVMYVFSQTFKLELPPGQNKIISKEASPNLDGSPFLNEEWAKGSIIMKNGDTIPEIMLRYNFHHGEMQFQHKEKVYAIGTPEVIKEVIMDGHTFVYLSYSDGGVSKSSFFETLCAGKSSLFALYYPQILPANYNVALNSGNKNDQLILRKKFFLKKGESVLPIDKKGKNLISAFEQKGKEIQKYAKDNNLSFKKEPDLITITKYVNSLN